MKINRALSEFHGSRSVLTHHITGVHIPASGQVSIDHQQVVLIAGLPEVVLIHVIRLKDIRVTNHWPLSCAVTSSCVVHYRGANSRGRNNSPDCRFLLSVALPQDQQVLKVWRSVHNCPTRFSCLNLNQENHFNQNYVTTFSNSQYNISSNSVVRTEISHNCVQISL